MSHALPLLHPQTHHIMCSQVCNSEVQGAGMGINSGAWEDEMETTLLDELSFASSSLK